MPVIIDNQKFIQTKFSNIKEKLNNINSQEDLINKITNISFKNYIGRPSFENNEDFHTVYSIAPGFENEFKCLWYYSAKDTIHYLGLYTLENNTYTKNEESSPPLSPQTLTIPKERENMDPEGSTLGYEEFQYIDLNKVTLNRDHIIPFDTIMTFVNILLDLEDFKYNEWFKTALQTYQFKRNAEAKELYKRAIENEAVKNEALNHQSTFLEKKIFQKTDDNDKKAEIILKWLYEPYIIVKKIQTENKSKTKSEIEQIIKKLEDEKLDVLAGTIRLESSELQTNHPKTILPSSFFTDKDGKYIDVNSLLERFDNRTLQPSDEFIIKKATGWMPGNIFRAPKPKPQDKGNEFDCTVAASVIRQGLSTFSDFLKKYFEAYNKINDFINNNNFNTANIAIEKLADIARHPNFRPFIYTNWKYVEAGYYPNKIFDLNTQRIIDNDEFITKGKVLTKENIVKEFKCKLK